MRRTPTFAALAVLTTTPALHAQPVAPAVSAVAPSLSQALAPPAELPVLVDQLGSPDYRARERAARSLAQFGDRALPHLKTALAAGRDPETARRLDLLVRKLDAERLTTARKVTLVGKNMGVKTALSSIARQSGYSVRIEGLGDTEHKYAFDLTDVPFWQALDAVCDAAGLTANLQDDNGKVSVYFSDSYNPFVAYSGPFRVVAANVNTNQNLQLSGLSRGRAFTRQPEYLGVNFQITSEPKAPLVGVGQVEAIRAVDDTGASLLPQPDANQPRTSYYPPQMSYRSYNLSAGLNLARAARGAAEVKELKARVPVMVLSETRADAVLPNITAAKGKKASGREIDVEVTSVTEANGGLSVSLLLTRRNGNPDDYGWMNGLTQRIEILDEKGQKLQLGSVDQNNSGQNVTTMSFTFTPATGATSVKPAKLVLLEWVSVTKMVEFTMKNIPLP